MLELVSVHVSGPFESLHVTAAHHHRPLGVFRAAPLRPFTMPVSLEIVAVKLTAAP